MCFARPIVAALPFENLAARLIKNNEAGILVAPNDLGALKRAIEMLYQSRSLGLAYGEKAQRYAATHFDIEEITDRFENVILKL